MSSPSEVRGNLGREEPVAGPSNAQPPSNAGSASGPARPRYMAPFFPHGAQPEIIRASQKDLFYLGQLNDQLQEVLRGIFGTRWLQSWIEEIGIAGGLAYYGLTTLIGSQTLGEEYVDILQYDSRTAKIPTLRARIGLLASHVLAPYLLAKAYARVKRMITERRAITAQLASSGNDAYILNEQEPLFADDSIHERPRPQSRTFLSRLPLMSVLSSMELPTFGSLVDEHLRTVHLAIFYLFGRYYHVAKRFLRIRYLSLHDKSGRGGAKPPSYEVLGIMMIVQLSVRVLSVLHKRRKARKEAEHQARIASGEVVIEQKPVARIDNVPVTDLTFDPEADDDEEEEEELGEDEEARNVRKCTLCLGPRKDPACTECGHIFCFTCIVGWAREKAECPLCRSKVNLSRILPLYNA